MIQVSSDIPTGVPACVPGHRPKLVESRGAPAGHRIGTPCPPHWHVECAQCSIATVPTASRSVALLRWRGRPELFRIPLSELGDARVRVAMAIANAA